MKPEDVTRCWNIACDGAGSHTPNFREQLERFASAIESHVRAETVAMCKAKAAVEYCGYGRIKALIDWSAVDAELQTALDEKR